MTNCGLAGVLPTVVLVFGIHAGAAAQPPADDRGYIGVKGGLNRENAEDGLRGSTGAGGVAGGFALAPGWTIDVELWVPGYIRDSAGGPKHRDILVSGSAVRSFGRGGARPFVVMGLSAARTEDRLAICIADRVPFGGGQPSPVIVDCREVEPDARERQRQRFTSTGIYALGGGGVTLRFGSRVRVAPEVRIDLAVTSVIVRPAMAMLIAF